MFWRQPTSRLERKKQRCILLQSLEDRVLYSGNPVPDVMIDMPSDEMINEAFQFTVDFDNTSANPSDVGYVPYIDLSVPDSIDLTGASYLGSPVTMTLAGTFDATGQLTDTGGIPVNHPLTDLPVTGGTSGEALYVIELPFGSFVPDQPAASIEISASTNSAEGAMVGTAIDVTARGGFALGCDPLDNPGSDPAIIGAANVGSITPQVIDLVKDSDAPEMETSTGPSFPVTYSLTIDIADGETVTAMDVVDALPNSFVYLNDVAVTLAPGVAVTGQSITDTPVPGAPQNASDNDFLIEFASVTGTAADNDIEITYSIYVDRFDANGLSVLDATSGDDVLAMNDARVTASYGAAIVGDNDALTDYALEQQSISIQKDVAIVNDVGAAGATPGDTLEYTLDIQVSDYFSFSNVVIDDNFSDGQEFVTGFAPTFSIVENGTTTSGNFDVANYSVTLLADGSTDVSFDLFNEVPDGVLDGDLFVDATPNGGTTVRVTFRTTILDDFRTTFPSGDASVDLGDILTNSVTTTGTLPGGQLESDDSASQIQIAGPAITKEVYAVDQSIALAGEEVVAGHNVTYRIRLSLPTSDVENLVLTDYLPLPFLSAAEIVTFDNTAPDPLNPTAPPPPGTIAYGQFHTLHTVVPSTDPPGFAVDPVANSIAFNFGTFDVDPSAPSVIDLLFTVTGQDVPMADGLTLTNQVLASYGTTNAGTTNNAAIQPIVVAAPELLLTKGIVASTALSPVYTPGTTGPVPFTDPGLVTPAFAGGINSTNLMSSPIDSDLSNTDAGDLVKFAIVIENTGGADAFDVSVTDVLPAGFQIPAAGPGLNLEVLDGDGNAIAYAGAAADLFTTGITLIDPAPEGAVNSFDDAQVAGDGSNIIVITYDLELTVAAEPVSQIDNTAFIDAFGAVDGGNDHTFGNVNSDWDDDASVTVSIPTVSKTLLGTSIVNGDNLSNEAVIGETAQYEVTLTLPEGTMDLAQVVDSLDLGLSFVSLDSIEAQSGGVATADVTTSLGVGDFSDTATFDPSISGQTLTFDLGNLVNANTNNGVTETIVVTYTVLVTDVVGNQGEGIGTQLDNSAVVAWDLGGVTQTTAPADAEDLTVIESDLDISKTVSPLTADAGDAVTYTITVSHSLGSDTDAFDVTFSDVIPAAILTTFPGDFTITHSAAGDLSSDFQLSGNTLETIPGASFDLLLGETLTISINGTLSSSVSPGTTLTNTASVAWTSLDGVDPNERDGSGGVDDYADSHSVDLNITTPTVSKTLLGTSIVNGDNLSNEAVIGETAQYEVTLTLPEGTMDLAQVVDSLDLGLSFVSLDSIEAQSGGVATADVTTSLGVGDFSDTATFDPSISGQTLTFDLGNLVNANTNNGVTETIVVTYTVLVTDVVGNQGEGIGTQLDNSAVVAWDLGGVTQTTAPADAEDLTVIESDLDISKTVSPLTADAGDAVTYTITVSHSLGSDTDAFDVTFSDVIPAAILTTFPGDFTITHSAAGDLSSDFQLSGNTLETIPGASFDLLLGETLTISINGTLSSSVSPGTTLTNTASVAWTSLDGVDPNERDGSGGVDDYADSHSVDLNITAPTVSKTLLGTSIDNLTNSLSQAVIGELAQYQVSFQIPEGFIEAAQIVDTLDSGLEFVSLESVVARSGGLLTGDVTTSLGIGDFSDTSVFDPVLAGQTMTFSLGDITNVNVDNTSVETVTLTYTVRVQNLASSQSESNTLLNNSAFLAWDAGGTPVQTAPADATDIEIIEPVLNISKLASDDSPHLGDTITYTLSIEHDAASDTDAFDINIVDDLPVGLTLTLSSINVTGATVVSNNSVGNTIDLEVDQLLLGDTITITYEADLASDPSFFGLPLNNTAAALWTSLPGGSPGERTGGGGVDDYVNSQTESVTPVGADLSIVKDDSLATVAAGQTYTYAITVTNSGTDAATGVTVTDTLPLDRLQFVGTDDSANVVFDSGSGLITWSPVGSLDFNAPNNVVTLNVTVAVRDPLAAGIDNVTNSASVTHNDVEPTPADTVDLDVDTIDAAPDYTITKDDSLSSAQPGDTITYAITISNIGTQDGTGITINDVFPVSVLTNVVASSGGLVDSLAGTISWSLGALAAGDSRIFTVTADVLDPIGAGIDDFTNTVNVTDDGSNGADPTPGNNQDTDTDTLVATPDYTIVKDDALASAAPGDAITYTIIVSNVGNQDGTGVMISDSFPTNVLTNVVADNGGVVDAVAGTIAWNLGNLDAGDNVVLTVTADVLNPVGAGIDDFTNTADVTDDGANGPDPTPGDNSDTDTDLLDAAPDYTIVKDDTITTASPGDAITYTITVNNVGNQNGTGVIVDDVFPANVLTNVIADNGGVVDAVAGTIAWNLGNLDAGDSVVLTVTADVIDPAGAGIDDFTNAVTVTDDLANGADPTPANNQDTDTDILDASPDYVVTKDDSLTTALPGETITYTIAVRNVGNQDGTGVVVSDTYPISVLENVVVSHSGVVDTLAGTITWNLGALAAGATEIITVTASVLNPVGAGIDDFTNTVNVTDDGSNGVDPTPGNNQDTDTDTLVATPDYTIVKDDSVLEAQPGESITYTITVNNIGDQNGTGVVVDDVFPTNVLTNVVADNGGVVDAVAGTIAWNLGNLDAGDNVVLTVTADVLDPVGAGIDDFTNTVNVTDDGSNGADPTPGNNQDTDTDTLVATPDYTIVKDDALASAAPGDTITYTIIVSNVGNQDGTGVMISDSFPTNVLTNVVADNGGVVDAVAGTIAWNLGNLDAGDNVVLTVTADVLNPVGAGIDDFTNTADVTDDGANGPDPTPGDNSDTDTDLLDAAPDYTIVKDDTITTASPGDAITYTITVNNVGNQNGTGVIVDDVFPANVLTNVTADNGGVVDAVAGTIAWNLGNLDAGDSVVLTVTADVIDPAGAGIDDFTNAVTVTDDLANGADPTPANNQDTDTDILDASPDYVVTKDDSLTTALPGETITYTIAVRNVGNQDGTGVVVSDTYPISVLENVVVSHSGVVDTLAGTITWNLGALAAGATEIITVTASVLNPVGAGIDDFTNTVNVTDDGSNGVDPTPGNNQDTDTDTLVATPDYTIVKDDSVLEAQPGESITYTITVNNIGDQNGTGVVVDDVFPTNVLTNVVADNGGVVDAVAGTIAWNLGNLDAGDNVVLTVTADVLDPVGAGIDDFTNTVNVTDDGSNGADPTPGNNQDTDTDTLVATPDYTIVKDDALASAAPGDTITYTIIVSNVGNQDGTGVMISDSFPTNVLTNVVADNGGVVDAVAGTIAWNLGNLDAGDNVVLTVTADVLNPVGAGIDDFTNTADVTDDGANGPDPTPGDNSDTDTDLLDAAPDYTIVKDDTITTASPGDAITYTITVNNVGNQNGTGVIVDDVFPANVLTNVTADNGGVVDAVAGTIAWNLGNLDAGDSVVLTVTADVIDPAGAGIDDFTNAVTVTDDLANGADPTPANNQDTDTDILDASPDYVVTKDDSLTTALPGETITYTIAVRNVGNQDGTGLIVTDDFPAFALENVVASHGGSIDSVSGIITWNFTHLDAGDTILISVSADVIDPAMAGVIDFTNTVSVTDDGTGGPDPSPANNTDSDTNVLVATPDYSISKDDGFLTVQPGDIVTYTIRVSNDGTQDGANVVVTDDFPHDAFISVAGDNGGIVDMANGTITWNLPTLAAGEVRILTVTAAMPNSAPIGLERLINIVNVQDDGANGPDPTPDNNQARDENDVEAVPDLSIVKTANVAVVQQGDTVVYTLTYSNDGNQDAQDVIISEMLPPNTTYNPAASTPGWLDLGGGRFEFSAGDLSAGETRSVEFAIDLDINIGNSVDNTALIADNGLGGVDPTPQNSASTASSAVGTIAIGAISKRLLLTTTSTGAYVSLAPLP